MRSSVQTRCVREPISYYFPAEGRCHHCPGFGSASVRSEPAPLPLCTPSPRPPLSQAAFGNLSRQHPQVRGLGLRPHAILHQFPSQW